MRKMPDGANPSGRAVSLTDLQESVQDRSAFKKLADYVGIASEFLAFVKKTKPTRIVSPSVSNYVFYQYDRTYGHKITRPLNTDLLIESPAEFKAAFERFIDFLADLRRYEGEAAGRKGCRQYVESKEINKVVYTVQQAIGSIGDSFTEPNQSRKRVGDLFEMLVKLIIQEVGVDCESRTINLPIPGFAGYKMKYQLDLVFSRDKAIIASETKFLHPNFMSVVESLLRKWNKPCSSTSKADRSKGDNFTTFAAFAALFFAFHFAFPMRKQPYFEGFFALLFMKSSPDRVSVYAFLPFSLSLLAGIRKPRRMFRMIIWLVLELSILAS
jgi:hypothetical protein